jgi:hypothetical protein
MRGNTLQRKVWSQTVDSGRLLCVTKGSGVNPSRAQWLSLFDFAGFAAQFGLWLNDFLKTEGAECRM